MAFEGSLSDQSFAEVLRQLAETAETGILTMQGHDEIIGVTFLEGEVVSVDAVNQAPEEGLGLILENTGQVSRDQFATLVAENQAGGGRVMDLLVERGFVDRPQLLVALRQQTLRLCAQVSTWREGRYRFYRGGQVSYEQGIEPLQVDDLLARIEVEGAPAPAAVPVVDRPTALVPPVEMPVAGQWGGDEGPEPIEAGQSRRRGRLSLRIDWSSVISPRLPGRLLGVGMLVGLAIFVVLAPQKLLVPLDTQDRIRVGLQAEAQKSLYAKVDQAAKSFFLLRGVFPKDLDELIDLDLLVRADSRISMKRRLAYTDAPVSYLLAIEGEPRVEGTIQTETISGNFLLDPDFSPPELVDTPPLVLLD